MKTPQIFELIKKGYRIRDKLIKLVQNNYIAFLCQVIQYIGELCRYLLAQPYSPSEKQHSVRVAFGNGLRPQIWNEFQSRFGISKIGELYGSTEGNVAFFNIDYTPCACGFVSVIFPKLLPFYFIKVDPITGELLRDKNGLAIQANTGEPGLVVGKIVKGSVSFSDITPHALLTGYC